MNLKQLKKLVGESSIKDFYNAASISSSNSCGGSLCQPSVSLHLFHFNSLCFCCCSPLGAGCWLEDPLLCTCSNLRGQCLLFCPMSAFSGQQLAQGMGDSGEHSNKEMAEHIRDAQKLSVGARSCCYPKHCLGLGSLGLKNLAVSGAHPAALEG